MPPKLTVNGSNDRGRWIKRAIVGSLVLVPIAIVVVLAILVTTSQPAVSESSTSLATIKLPFGGGTVTRVTAIAGREQKALAVKVIGDQVWPAAQVATGEPVTVEVQVRRPGWNGWLTGATQLVKLNETTPKATLASSFVTVKPGHDLTLHYSQPVSIFGSGADNASVVDRTLQSAEADLSLKPTAVAGSMSVAAAPRSWEIPAKESISWFPSGSSATAVADPAPGTQLKPHTRITMTFSKPVDTALDGHMPAISPAGAGTWRSLNSHTIQFDPAGYGYGLGATVQVSLPAGVHLVGGTGDPVGTWQVPTGSTTRLQQLLAELGYLPVDFTPSGEPVAATMSAQEAAAVKTPTGAFTWRWSNTPGAVKAQWVPGDYNEMTKAAVETFEADNDMTADGIDGPSVWKALIQADLQHQTNTFGYTFVYVHEAASGETEWTWHDGHVVASGAVNTGVSAAGGTATGVYAVFEHLRSTTMTGTNPDGSSYKDPGIPYVSYFNGGDALHGFIRSSYGFPQSDGCVEMPYAEAGKVWPYTPVGTVVEVNDAAAAA